MVLPVMMARRSMKFSLTDHCFSSPSFFRAGSRASWVQFDESKASRTVSCSAAKARVSSRVRFLGSEDLGGRHDVVGEEEAGEIAELAEGFDAGLHEWGDLSQSTRR